MKRVICGVMAVVVLMCADTLTAPRADATGSRFKGGPTMMPKLTMLSRSFRWRWDPFRVRGDKAYAVAWITNNHNYSLTLKTYCKADGRLERALSGWHSIAPGETLRWDTRRLVQEAGKNMNAVVSCKFWVDGSIDLRGQIVNSIPARMGRKGNPLSLVTFNFANFGPKNG